jgi:hypothetical protein
VTIRHALLPKRQCGWASENRIDERPAGQAVPGPAFGLGAATSSRTRDPAPAQPLRLIALGGNSLLDAGRPPTVENQFAVTAHAVLPIADLIEHGAHLILTHGNGPQVGFMQQRVELTRDQMHAVPLDSLIADSQGALGYMIQRDLREELDRRGVRAEVVTIVTEVEVATRPGPSRPSRWGLSTARPRPIA